MTNAIPSGSRIGFSGKPSTFSARPPLFGRGAMIATAHPLASQAGISALAHGGNAVDAAIAAAGVLTVVLPPLSGLGGDAFLLFRDGKSGSVSAVLGSGVVGERATPEYLASQGFVSDMPSTGALSAAVPGALGTYLTALEAWGSLPLQTLWAPAIKFARSGAPMSATLARRVQRGLGGVLNETSALRHTFLSGSRALVPGESFTQPDLAVTLSRLAESGPTGALELFYRGELGERIGRHVWANGGLFNEADLARHQTRVMTPLSYEYRGLKVHQVGPPSQGVISLEMLAILAGWDLDGADPLSAGVIHLIVEAKKAAFADRNAFLADPDASPFSAASLLEEAWVQERRNAISMHRASKARGSALPDGTGDTTYLAVADSQGNCVSLVTSLSNNFGSGVQVPGTGIILNNRAGRGFSLDPEHPNVIAPYKRTMHTLNCFIVTTPEGTPMLIGGTPGGDAQVQINTQLIIAAVDAGMDVQQAVTMPRWQHAPGTDPGTLNAPETLLLEQSFSEDVGEQLRSMGHSVTMTPRLPGAAQLIAIDPTGKAFAGGSDPRVEGNALCLA